ncbi:hypothetical protein QT383_19855 [Stenotrophomonas rhizophila]
MNETIYFYGLLAGVFLLAGLVKGVTGMGLPTAAMGLLGRTVAGCGGLDAVHSHLCHQCPGSCCPVHRWGRSCGGCGR